MKTDSRTGSLGRFALVAALIGAVGSVASELWVGWGNRSVVLIGMFTLWVLSPFAGFGWMARKADRATAWIGGVLHGVIIVLSLGALALYASVALGPRPAKPALPFLVMPLALWICVVLLVRVTGLTRPPKPAAPPPADDWPTRVRGG